MPSLTLRSGTSEHGRTAGADSRAREGKVAGCPGDVHELGEDVRWPYGLGRGKLRETFRLNHAREHKQVEGADCRTGGILPLSESRPVPVIPPRIRSTVCSSGGLFPFFLYRFARVVTKKAGEIYAYEYVHGTNPKKKILAAWSPTGADRTVTADLSLGKARLVRAERMPLTPGDVAAVEVPVKAGVASAPLEENPLFLWLEE